MSQIVYGGTRSDGYDFYGQYRGRDFIIVAGCRAFTVAQARKHWRATRKGTQLGAESLTLVAHLVALAKIRKLKPVKEEK